MENLDNVRVPISTSQIWKEECVYSFHTHDSEGGILVDMKTWLAYSPEHANDNYHKTGNALYLNIKRSRTSKKGPADEDVGKPGVLGIGVEGGFNEKEYVYSFNYTVAVFPENTRVLVDDNLPWKIRETANAIIKADSAEKKEEIKQWVDDSKPVESQLAKDLVQIENGVQIGDKETWACKDCGGGAATNLWLNLMDGHIGCGRANWDGSGGQGHALEHYRKNGFPLVVKLGTVTAAGTADVFSYSEDRMIIDPYLDQHLKHFGLDMSKMKKTDKTVAELEIELQHTFDWSKASESQKKLIPLAGPGFTGLENLGNTCYMNSIIQTIFKIPEFVHQYYDQRDVIFKSEDSPAKSLRVQMCKLADGLISGKYSPLPEGGDETVTGYIKPSMFKALVGEGHPDFSTNRQQDALEYFQHLLNLLDRSERVHGNDPSKVFQFHLENRNQCFASGCVDYIDQLESILSLGIPVEKCTNKDEVDAYNATEAAKSEEEKKRERETHSETEPIRPLIPLNACLQTFAETEAIDDWTSPVTNEKTVCLKQKRFKTFPPYLVIHAMRFTQQDMQLKKLDVFLDVPDVLDIEYLRSTGRKEDEKEMPKAEPVALVPDEEVVEALIGMGFTRNRSIHAWFNTQGQGAEGAANWIFGHMDTPEHELPLQSAGGKSSGNDNGPDVDEAVVLQLCEFGFTPAQVIRALKSTENNPERAVEWLFSHPEDVEMDLDGAVGEGKQDHQVSDGPGRYQLFAFITHMGKSTMSGHYVAHINVDGKWVIYDDRRVAESQEPPKELAYLYLYKRID